jgi:hypothetical protein
MAAMNEIWGLCGLGAVCIIAVSFTDCNFKGRKYLLISGIIIIILGIIDLFFELSK